MARLAAYTSGVLIAGSLAAACQIERTYHVRGRVVGFGSDSTTVIVSHEAISGLMPGMTMPFRARAYEAISGLHDGDHIAFDLHLTRIESWIENVRALTATDAPLDVADDTPRAIFGDASPHLFPGDPLPQVELLDQEGRTFDLATLAGRVTVMTFIYTRCPLPEYCPLTSQRLASLQQNLTRRFPRRIHFLSITIDPEFDSSSVLKQYAARYTTDLETWTFATGKAGEVARLSEALGVTVVRDGASIDHSLTTAVIDEDGTLSALWRGNTWDTDDLVARVEFLLARGSSASSSRSNAGWRGDS